MSNFIVQFVKQCHNFLNVIIVDHSKDKIGSKCNKSDVMGENSSSSSIYESPESASEIVPPSPVALCVL